MTDSVERLRTIFSALSVGEAFKIANEIETLRQQVKDLEKAVNHWFDQNLETTEKLAALKQEQGEPVAWISHSSTKWFGVGNGIGQFSYTRFDVYEIPLYTSAPTILKGDQ